MPDPFVKRQAKKAKAAETFREKEAKSLTQSIGTASPTVKPLVQPREKDDVKPTNYEPYTEKDVYKLPSNIERISTRERRVNPKGPDYALQKFTQSLSNDPYKQAVTDSYKNSAYEKGISYAHIVADNIIGFDNGYDTALEKLAVEFNKDEIGFMKKLAYGVWDEFEDFKENPYDYSKKFITDWASDVSLSASNLWTMSLRKRLDIMFGVTPENATDTQMNQAREATIGDVMKVAEAGVVTKVAADVGSLAYSLAKKGVKTAGPPIVSSVGQASKDFVEGTKIAYKEDVLPAISAIEEVVTQVPESFKKIRSALAKPTTGNLFKDIKEVADDTGLSAMLNETVATPVKEVAQDVVDSLKELSNNTFDKISIVDNKPKFIKKSMVFTNKKDSPTNKDSFETQEIDVEKASPYLFEIRTAEMIDSYNGNPINQGLYEDTKFVTSNSYLKNHLDNSKPITYYRGKFNKGRGMQTFSRVARALNNFPEYSTLKRKRIISPRQVWKHISSSKVGAMPVLMNVGGEDLFAYKSYRYFWDEGIIPDDHIFPEDDAKAEQYFDIIEQSLDKHASDVKNPSKSTFYNRQLNQEETRYSIPLGNDGLSFYDTEDFNSHTQLTNNSYFNFVNKEFQVLGKSSLGGLTPYKPTVNFEIDIRTDMDTAGRGTSVASSTLDLEQNLLDANRIKEWNSKKWVRPNLNDYTDAYGQLTESDMQAISKLHQEIIKNRQNYVIRFGKGEASNIDDILPPQEFLDKHNIKGPYSGGFYSNAQKQVKAGYFFEPDEALSFDERTRLTDIDQRAGTTEVVNKTLEANNKYNYQNSGMITLRTPQDTRNHRFSDYLNEAKYSFDPSYPNITEDFGSESIEDLFFELKDLGMKDAQRDFNLPHRFKDVDDTDNFYTMAYEALNLNVNTGISSPTGSIQRNIDRFEDLRSVSRIFNSRQNLGGGSPENREIKYDSLLYFFTHVTAPYVLTGIVKPEVISNPSGRMNRFGQPEKTEKVSDRQYIRLKPETIETNKGAISGISIVNPLVERINNIYDQVLKQNPEKVTTLKNSSELQNMVAHKDVNYGTQIAGNDDNSLTSLEMGAISSFKGSLVLDPKYDRNEPNLYDKSIIEEPPTDMSRIFNETDARLEMEKINDVSVDLAKIFVIKEVDPVKYKELLNIILTQDHNKNTFDLSYRPGVSKDELNYLQSLGPYSSDNNLFQEYLVFNTSQKDFDSSRSDHVNSIDDTLLENTKFANIFMDVDVDTPDDLDYKSKKELFRKLYNEDYAGIQDKLFDIKEKAVAYYGGNLNQKERDRVLENTFNKPDKYQYIFTKNSQTLNPKFYRDLQTWSGSNQQSFTRLSNAKLFSVLGGLDPYKKLSTKDLLNNATRIEKHIIEKDKIFTENMFYNNKLSPLAEKLKGSEGEYGSPSRTLDGLLKMATQNHSQGAEALGHSRYSFSPNKESMILEELQFDSLQSYSKNKRAQLLEDQLDRDGNFKKQSIPITKLNLPPLVNHINDILGHQGEAKNFFDKPTKDNRGRPLENSNKNIGIDDFFAANNSNGHSESILEHGSSTGISSDDYNVNHTRKLKLETNSIEVNNGAIVTKIKTKDGQPFVFEDLAYINELTSYLKMAIDERNSIGKSPPPLYKEKVFDKDGEPIARRLFSQTRYQHMREFRNSSLKKVAPSLKDLEIEARIYNKPLSSGKLHGGRELFSYLRSLMQNSTLDQANLQIQNMLREGAIAFEIKRTKSKKQAQAEVEEKYNKELEQGLLPIASETEAIEKLFSALILEAKRNGAKNIVIPPIDRLAMLRYKESIGDSSKIPYQFLKRYTTNLNEALNNIIKKSGGQLSASIKERSYFPHDEEGNIIMPKIMTNDASIIPSLEKYKVRVLNIEKLFEDIPQNKKVTIKVGMAEGGLVA